ncbi:MAG: hypothetical protein MUF42_05245 [Cytophagaceae bacterium]|jgi:cytochrome c peroxidase|nr:hypothetical protein [Cytophagaceae bacterium]
MKWTFFSLFTFILIVCFALRSRQFPSEVIRNEYKEHYRILQQEVDRMYAMIKEKRPASSLLLQFTRSRLAFKNCQWWMEYQEPGLKNINGADLIRVDNAQADYAEIPPKGFQVLERLLHEKKIDYIELQKQAEGLSFALKEFHQIYPTFPAQEWQILDALRLEIIRISFLGLSSFDNPIQKNGIQESKHAWLGLCSKLAAFDAYAQQYAPLHYSRYRSLLSLGDSSYFTGGIEDFDHFGFISQRSIPLFKSLGVLHRTSGLERPEEAGVNNRSWNYDTLSYFDEDFFNPWFFSPYKHESHQSARIELGKRLFFDPILSKQKEVSCATCHQPERLYSDGLPLSTTGHGQVAKRNTPGLTNVALQAAYFWDLRGAHLEHQIQQVVRNPSEFDSNYLLLQQRLYNDSSYRPQFAKAFPEEKNPVNEITINASLASFLRSLVRHASPFDSMLRRQRQPDKEVRQGFNLFMGKARCATCHFPPEFSGLVPPYYTESESEVLGVPDADHRKVPLDDDAGRDNREVSVWYRSFKTPGLRNVAGTAPYMHNGVFADLPAVMDFYNDGGGIGRGLHLNNQTLPPESLHLTKQEIRRIIHFLNALHQPMHK